MPTKPEIPVQSLIAQRAEIMIDLRAARLRWLGERAQSGFANTEYLDVLLIDLFVLDSDIVLQSVV